MAFNYLDQDREDELVARIYKPRELYRDQSGFFYFDSQSDLESNHPCYLSRPRNDLLHKHSSLLYGFLARQGLGNGDYIIDNHGEKWYFLEEQWVNENDIADRNRGGMAKVQLALL